MSMSMHVQAFCPPDEKWRKMRAVHDACQAAGLSIPREVDDYFDGGFPDERGVEIGQGALKKAGAVIEWRDDNSEGLEVHIDKLPKDVKVVRFSISY